MLASASCAPFCGIRALALKLRGMRLLSAPFSVKPSLRQAHLVRRVVPTEEEMDVLVAGGRHGKVHHLLLFGGRVKRDEVAATTAASHVGFVPRCRQRNVHEGLGGRR